MLVSGPRAAPVSFTRPKNRSVSPSELVKERSRSSGVSYRSGSESRVPERSMIMSYLQRCLVAVVSIMTAACDGGNGDGNVNGGNGGASAQIRTGSFIDAPVRGLSYDTDSVSGITNANGDFRYEAGETIRLSFGGISLGQARGQSILTPLDLYPEQPDHQRALMSFLQSLDADSDLANGIDLTDQRADQLREIVREQPEADTFPEFTSRSDYAQLAGRMTNRASWIDDQEALDAFSAEIAPLISSGAYQRPSNGGSTTGVCPEQPILPRSLIESFNDCGPATSTRIPEPTAVVHGFGGTEPRDPDGMSNQTACILPGWDDNVASAFPDLPDVSIHATDLIYYNTSPSFGIITFTGQRVVWTDLNGGLSAGYVCGETARNVEYNDTCVCP